MLHKLTILNKMKIIVDLLLLQIIKKINKQKSKITQTK